MQVANYLFKLYYGGWVDLAAWFHLPSSTFPYIHPLNPCRRIRETFPPPHPPGPSSHDWTYPPARWLYPILYYTNGPFLVMLNLLNVRSSRGRTPKFRPGTRKGDDAWKLSEPASNSSTSYLPENLAIATTVMTDVDLETCPFTSDLDVPPASSRPLAFQGLRYLSLIMAPNISLTRASLTVGLSYRTQPGCYMQSSIRLGRIPHYNWTSLMTISLGSVASPVFGRRAYS